MAAGMLITDGSPLDQARRAEGAGTGRPRRIESRTLFNDAREIVIVHRGQEYRLRVTKADKLILTK